MKFATISILAFLIFSILPSPSFAVDQPSTIQVSVENSSLKKGYFEVKDSMCSEDISNECKLAEIFLNSKKCTNHERKEECRKSKEIIESAECVEGILFYGWLESGESVQLNICTDHTNNGRISTRNSQTAPWTLYNWVETGETISIK